MRSTSIAYSVKKWLNSWNQQLPLSQRESKKLLNALNDSFRNRLDEEYPQHANASQSSPSRKLKSQQSDKADQEDGVNRFSAVHSTDRHLAAVLTSPLFAGPSRAQKPAPKRPTPASESVSQRDAVKSTIQQTLRAVESSTTKDASPRAAEAPSINIAYEKVGPPVNSQPNLAGKLLNTKAASDSYSFPAAVAKSSVEGEPDGSRTRTKRIPIERVLTKQEMTVEPPAKVSRPIKSKVVEKHRSATEVEYRFGGVFGEAV